MASEPRTEPSRRRDDFGTIAMLVGTAISAISVLIYQPVAGRALGTDGFAPIAVLWTMMFVIYTVLMIPIEQFITRKLVVTGGGHGWLERTTVERWHSCWGAVGSLGWRSSPQRLARSSTGIRPSS